MDAVETAIVQGEQKKIEGTGFVKDTHSLKNIADKTVNLPADPADESEVEAAIAASEAVVTGAISTSEGVITGKVDDIQSDVSSIKGTVEALPTQADLEASEVLAMEADVEAAIAVTDGKVDDVQSDVTLIKAATDNLPVDPASEASVEGAVSAAHRVTDGKVDDVQSAVEALPTLAEIEASTALAKEASVGALPTLVEIEASAVLAKEASVGALPTLAEIEASTALAKEASVGALPTLVEIEASAVLAKEASVGALPTLVEIEGSAVLAKDATVAKDSTVAKEATLTHATYGLDKIKAETAAIKAKTDLIPAELVGLLCAVGGGPYVLSDDVLVADDSIVSKDSADYVKVKEINVGYLSGTLRVVFDSRDPSGLEHWVHARIYRNGVAVGTEGSQNGDWYTYSEDIAGFAKNDLVQLYVKNSDVGFPIEVRNFRVLGKYPVPSVPYVVAVP